MNEYINRGELLNIINENVAEAHNERCAQLLEAILSAPTADVEQVRHGHWVKQKPDPEAMKIIHDMGLGKGMSVNSIYWTCSICENWGTPTHKYCCSCGAKMDAERSENGTS